jgi:uncharacterized protein YjaG (DUF416 family)
MDISKKLKRLIIWNGVSTCLLSFSSIYTIKERVDLHDTNSSELSVSTGSVSTLPYLEGTDAERVLNEEEKKKTRDKKRGKRKEEGAAAR